MCLCVCICLWIHGGERNRYIFKTTPREHISGKCVMWAHPTSQGESTLCDMDFQRNNGHSKFLSHTPSCQRLLNMDSCPPMHSRIKIRGCLTRCLQGCPPLLSTKMFQTAPLRLFALMNRWCLKPYGILYLP